MEGVLLKRVALHFINKLKIALKDNSYDNKAKTNSSVSSIRHFVYV